MSATRSQRRREKRAAGRPKAEAPLLNAREVIFRKLRRRVRLVLIATSFVGFLLLRAFQQPITGFLQSYGMAAQLSLILLLLSPALLTWVIGLGELRDVK